jgi:hypothetical protein
MLSDNSTIHGCLGAGNKIVSISVVTSELLRIAAYLAKAPSSHTPPQEFCGWYTNPSGGSNEE